MSHYRTAVIGCGRANPVQGNVMEGFAIAYQHAAGYQAIDNVSLVAAADIDQTNLKAFAQRFSVPGTYTDYREMLEQEKPDLLSICTWPALHSEMVIAAAQSGVRGILCEKPMALSLREAEQMIAVCKQHGTMLSISHQRRLTRPWTIAHEWVSKGKIGQLIRMDGWIENWDLLSYGTHWIDLFFYFTNDRPAQWVFSQCDFTQRQSRYAHPVEDRSLTMIGFENEVTGLLHLAPEARGVGMRLIGTEGQIELREGADLPRLISNSLQSEETALSGFRADAGYSAIEQDLIKAIEAGHPLQVSPNQGLRATEVIMAAFASSLDRRLITFPYNDPTFSVSQIFEHLAQG